MNKPFLFFAFIFITNFSLAQEQQSISSVMPAQGGFDKTESMSLEWSLGENFVETIYLENQILTQGFHQSFLSLDLTKENLFKSVIYPNPIASELNIEINSSENSSYILSLFEIRGRLIKQTSTDSNASKIIFKIDDLPTGMYFLQISNLNGAINEVHKIIKL